MSMSTRILSCSAQYSGLVVILISIQRSSNLQTPQKQCQRINLAFAKMLLNSFQPYANAFITMLSTGLKVRTFGTPDNKQHFKEVLLVAFTYM